MGYEHKIFSEMLQNGGGVIGHSERLGTQKLWRRGRAGVDEPGQRGEEADTPVHGQRPANDKSEPGGV